MATYRISRDTDRWGIRGDNWTVQRWVDSNELSPLRFDTYREAQEWVDGETVEGDMIQIVA